MSKPFKTCKVDKASGLGQALFSVCSQDNAAKGALRRLREGGGRERGLRGKGALGYLDISGCEESVSGRAL